jgi:glucan biosynthesis protein C
MQHTLNPARIEGAHPAAGTSATARLTAIDRVRVGLTALVVAHHAGQAYGPTGGRWPIFEDERASILGPFFSVNAAFFMGLFFLLAGIFTPAALDRKGTARFLSERLLRLGLPVAVLGLGLFAPIGFAEDSHGLSFPAFLLQVYLPQIEVGHLWFLVHLLAYAGLYALWRVCGGLALERRWESFAPPSQRALAGYTLLLGLITAAVRVEYPIDRWVHLAGLVPSEVAHLPQYLSLFVIGLIAGRAGWLNRLPARTGWIWLAIGLAAAVLRYAYGLGGDQLFPERIIAPGGPDWRSLVWSLWEAVICVGLCAGLLTLSAHRSASRWMARLAPQAYTVYIIHVFVVVGLQGLIAGLAAPPLAKFMAVTLIAIPLCFALAFAIRRIPGATRVL